MQVLGIVMGRSFNKYRSFGNRVILTAATLPKNEIGTPDFKQAPKSGYTCWIVGSENGSQLWCNINAKIGKFID